MTWSSSDRFIYLNSFYHISYIDTFSGGLSSPIQFGSILSVLDGGNPGNRSYLGTPFLGPDENIYYSAQCRILSRLTNPDQNNGLPVFEGNSLSISSPPPGGLVPTSAYVNLKLGPIDGSICDSLGIDAIGFNEIKRPIEKVELFPNPAQDYVTIKFIGIATHYKLYSLQGNLVDAGVVSNNTIKLGPLQAGAYIVEVKSGQKVYYGKVLKRE